MSFLFSRTPLVLEIIHFFFFLLFTPYHPLGIANPSLSLLFVSRSIFSTRSNPSMAPLDWITSLVLRRYVFFGFLPSSPRFTRLFQLDPILLSMFQLFLTETCGPIYLCGRYTPNPRFPAFVMARLRDAQWRSGGLGGPING